MKKENLKIQQILSLAIENHKKNNFELAESLYNKILKIDVNLIFKAVKCNQKIKRKLSVAKAV